MNENTFKIKNTSINFSKLNIFNNFQFKQLDTTANKLNDFTFNEKKDSEKNVLQISKSIDIPSN